MATILKVRHEFTVNGNLTDPTAIALADSTGTYGIRKTGGDNVIVADTAMAKISTGVYEYNFTEANGAEYDQAYTSYVKVTYGGTDYYDDEDHAAVDEDDAASYSTDYVTNLETTRLRVSQRLAEVHANPKPSYSVNGQTIQWSGYCNMLTESLARLNKLIEQGEVDDEPFEIASQGIT